MVTLYYRVDDVLIDYDNIPDDVLSYLDSVNVERFVTQFVLFCNKFHPNEKISLTVEVRNNSGDKERNMYYLTLVKAGYNRASKHYFYKAIGYNNVHSIRKQMLNMEEAFKFAQGEK